MDNIYFNKLHQLHNKIWNEEHFHLLTGVKKSSLIHQRKPTNPSLTTGEKFGDLQLRLPKHYMNKCLRNIIGTSCQTPLSTKNYGKGNNTWHRDLTTDLKIIGKTWGEIMKLAKDRKRWKANSMPYIPMRRSGLSQVK
ncbi:Hypothetical predicted protein [Mytilus galloprovincialis]|uniref:Uncharacterized protein n=1 Tax=Mytilus galloprovincialis TaxID=29158 RepID=A0A8B6H7B2_MYTGA|nr:Hypothetical predicted protein [Mytilus galloprovincialis]